ncbi:hypothetical protein L861_13915 [Litchfieldella anticariensis FP35 = DSM 16096]|uniref:Transcriptional regulator n=1 Tax=Litchfieldella anticariensis (strain DSM 16096 / CECT 5854 / CIP 108499 / LMG 22089 / FP35) TaxID=1121939 RepID=S2KES5_LITA3|nr:hypothetical protein [Halomonas anticariensis]EPC00365.1 hypothetical protein L861_13915 [Halomonas anticariensis FP35 = DSM 16096]
MHSHKVKIEEVPDIASEEFVELRERLHMSLGVFAIYLRTNKRPLENWEQGRANPNAQAKTMIRLVQK